MDKTELISVIMPVYNAEKYLREAIMSVINQTYKNLEIIIINDGSTDSSEEICEYFVVMDKRIKLVNKQNEGVSAARNIGIDLAKGTFIGFVDSDDICELDLYEKLYNAVKSSNSDIAMCMYSILLDKSKRVQKEPLRVGYYSNDQIQNEIILPMIGSPMTAPQCAPVWGSVCRSIYCPSIINKTVSIRFRKITIAEDLLFNVEYLSRCKSAVVVGNSLYNYRINANSATHAYINDMYRTVTKERSLMKDTLIKNNLFSKKMQEYYNVSVMYGMAWCITNECNDRNPLSKKEIIQRIRQYRNAPEFKGVLLWKCIRHFTTNEKYYFLLIKLRLYYLILWFNRRKK